MDYKLELDRIVKQINNNNYKLVCIQLPDGLKPLAKDIQKHLETKTDSTILIWGGSCFGACDIPLELESIDIDLLVQLGHSEWK